MPSARPRHSFKVLGGHDVLDVIAVHNTVRAIKGALQYLEEHRGGRLHGRKRALVVEHEQALTGLDILLRNPRDRQVRDGDCVRTRMLLSH